MCATRCGGLSAWDPRGRESFSQSGEEMIAGYIFDVVGVSTPTYLGIGAHHPFELSNTAAFYKTGSRGVNVDLAIPYHRLLERLCRSGQRLY